MFTTFRYGIVNKKTGDVSSIETYSPIEGNWISWGLNDDGTSAQWDVMRNDPTVNIRCDDGTVIPVWGNNLRRLYNELSVVFAAEEQPL